jgi:RNA-directed DNA polymerase
MEDFLQSELHQDFDGLANYDFQEGDKSFNELLYQSCDELQENFYKLETGRDISSILNIQYGHFVFHIYRRRDEHKYVRFEIPKKSGGHREILSPRGSLKIIQRKLSQVLNSVYIPRPCVHGFAPGRSIISNAHAHVGKTYVLNVDLKDFFPSVNFGRVRGMFLAKPYSCNEAVASVLAKICCHNNQLPQGAPTSPVISNMLCASMDGQLQRLAKRHKCTYTRYADDITFSTTLSRFPEGLASLVGEDSVAEVVLGEDLISTIEDNGFTVNQKKIRLQHKRNHQEVTGLTVNKFPNVDRDYVRKISSMLHVWDKFGLKALEDPTGKEKLYGKIDFLGMVRGRDNPIYQKYLTWYRTLSRSETQDSSATLEVKFPVSKMFNNKELKVVLEPRDGGGYTIYVPSLSDCVSQGDTIDEAIANIQDAIALHPKS